MLMGAHPAPVITNPLPLFVRRPAPQDTPQLDSPTLPLEATARLAQSATARPLSLGPPTPMYKTALAPISCSSHAYPPDSATDRLGEGE